MKRALVITLLAAGCYSPSPLDKGWRCDSSNKYQCPVGLTCDQAAGLCVKELPPDLGPGDLGSGFDGTIVAEPRSCAGRVKDGAFSGFTALAAINTGGDEKHIALAPDGRRIYFTSGGTLMTADLPSPMSPAAPQAVAIAGFTGTYNGGTIAFDNTLWFAGHDGASAQLYGTTRTSATAFVVNATRVKPTRAACTLLNPVFFDGRPTDEMYFEGNFSGCTTAGLSTKGDIMKGLAVFNYETFTKVLTDTDVHAPALVPGNPTGMMMVFSMGPAGQLYQLSRDGKTYDWRDPAPIPGSSGGDLQAVISLDCLTIYLVSTRAGGKGGSDIWAATIAAQ